MNLRALAPLNRFFETPPDCQHSTELSELVERIINYRAVVFRNEMHIAFVGAFNVGKSSLINRLLGMDVLPIGFNRSTSVITHIMRGEQPEAYVIRPGDQRRKEESIRFGEITKYIVFDHTAFPPVEPTNVAEVHLYVPVPMLPPGCVMIDTPGLMNSMALMRKVNAEIEQSDLVIMVLAADQIASELERDVVLAVNEMLAGNIAFVVNRKDRVPEEKHAKILRWVHKYFEDHGNPIVGQTRIFMLSAAHDSNEVVTHVIGEWLNSILEDHTRKVLLLHTRLNMLDNLLSQLIGTIQHDVEEQQRRLAEVRSEQLSRNEKQYQDVSKVVRNMRASLPSIRADIPIYYAQFAQRLIEETGSFKGSAQERAMRLQNGFFVALEGYVHAVTTRVDEILAKRTFIIPRFEPTALRQLELVDQTVPNVDARAAMSSAMVGIVFGLFTGIIGGVGVGLLSSLLMTKQTKKPTKNINRLASEYKSILVAETHAYLDQLDVLLRRTLTAPPSSGSMRATADISEAQTEEQHNLLNWGLRFQDTLRQIMNDGGG